MMSLLKKFCSVAEQVLTSEKVKPQTVLAVFAGLEGDKDNKRDKPHLKLARRLYETVKGCAFIPTVGGGGCCS